MEDDSHDWNAQHELILRQWGETCACYRFMHNRAYLLYKDLNMRFSLPVIVLSTITGTANFAQSTLPDSWQAVAPSAIGGLNLIAGLIATVMQFLKVNELMENHRAASLAHSLLSRNIRLMVAIPYAERKTGGLKFVEDCKTEYDRLLEQSPAIPKKIMLNFEQIYPTDNLFTRPDFNVRPIQLLEPPKTIEHFEAITKDTPLARVGRFFSGTKSSGSKSPTSSISKNGVTLDEEIRNEIQKEIDEVSERMDDNDVNDKLNKIVSGEKLIKDRLSRGSSKGNARRQKEALSIVANEDSEEEMEKDNEIVSEEEKDDEDEDDIWTKDVDIELGIMKNP
ncbi:hypothetical protein PGAG_00201 [Phaeocystis globosa virus 12T]|uniref:Uncharacterized protein n=1 Tax=Phaeocystis globosa virus PgV-16T TaxID=3071227 RepID=A0AC59EX71_9VIRU|nr:hypothetical protein PGCG_00241 [Phaeocystis globosa virus]AET73090.1 hypothetical protein PGAG_00201 [Phaeocystis globosa virus 12T]AGM15552.1 hypothetical protein PGCG_00241 [Phaeocystis globosa virus PgV-16T]